MQYDIVTKKLLEKGHKVLLSRFFGIDVAESEFIEELPQESTSIRSSDYPMKITDKNGTQYIFLLEIQTHWKTEKILDLIDYRVRF